MSDIVLGMGEVGEAIFGLLDERNFDCIGIDIESAKCKNYSENDTIENPEYLHICLPGGLTEFVDNQIKIIIDAVKESGKEDNTLIIFSSDHGDNDASHRLEHKTTLYEESANIPFIVMWKNHIPEGIVDNKHLVSNGLDLLPTVCDFAGIAAISDPRGKSLRPLLEDNSVAVEWRSTLGVESEIGRMVVDEDGFKYIRYDKAGIEEQLLYLGEDPHETTHFTSENKYVDKLNSLRKAFDSDWFPTVDK